MRASPQRIGHLIAHELSSHQRDVLIAMTVEDVAAKALAERLHSTRGALYKTLYGARGKLRQGLATEPQSINANVV